MFENNESAAARIRQHMVDLTCAGRKIANYGILEGTSQQLLERLAS